jgi:ABC-type oligopeptide transport system ATPase subunit
VNFLLSSSSPLVEFQSVSKYFRDRRNNIVTAVDDVSFTIDKGKILGLVGQSGSGKTTAARISVALTPASKGRVLVDGMDVGKIRNRKKLWVKAQYIHQDPYSSLDPYMTVREVLERPLRFLLHWKDQQVQEPITRMMEVIGLEMSFLQKRVQELSGGERQRIMIARAFITNPVYAVADEPTTMIDSVHRNSLLELLLRLKKEFNTSFLLITHDLSIAADLCDDVAIMQNGKIVEYGRRDSVLKNPREQYTKDLLSATPEKLVEAAAEL